MKRSCESLIVCLAAVICSASLDAAELSPSAALERSGVRGGLVVHIGCGEGRATAALRVSDAYIVHGLDPSAEKVAAARDHFSDKGVLGSVSASVLRGSALPYLDNTVNVLIAKDLGEIPMTEVMRVLCPTGAAYIAKSGKWTETRKPRPANIDEWTHYMHGPDNNAVADDTLVAPPRRLQWKAGPTFARHHDTLAGVSALVSSGGRIFYIIDEAPTTLMTFAPKWRLVARDAFNGVLLWKRSIGTWENYMRSFRSGPPQLPRRLVAAGGRVYVTLGINAPLTQLDAATGKILKTYKGTDGADEILLDGPRLLLVTIGASGRSILALEAKSGKVLWRKSGDETAGLQPMTLASSGGRVIFQCGREVRCADVETGKLLWRHGATQQPKPKTPVRRKRVKARRQRGASYHAPTVVICSEQKVVLSANQHSMAALDLETGKQLWSCPCPPDFHAPADVFLADGLVWAGLFANEGRDPRTGQVKRTLDITGLLTAGHHPRCYRNKATNRYIIASKRGMEFFDLKSSAHSRNNWVRGVCQYGIMPCNGLTYIPPNPCCCYPGAMLHGFYALAGAKPAAKGDGADPLIRGQAYEEAVMANRSRASDWPTLRGNPTRSGSTPHRLPTAATEVWTATVEGKLTAPVLGPDKIVVASVNLARITALDTRNGKEAWRFTAGGRVDSPPTIHNGLVLFGCADGWVYCLRATNGKLMWRFRAAPAERLTVVDEQLESVWPVHGNILVFGGVAYMAAGRSAYLDGGIYLYGLDPKTGKKLCEARVAIPHAEDKSKAFIMAGAKPDVLVTDGKYIYLQQIRFNKTLVRQTGLGRHLMNHSGLTDDTWFYRTFWRLGRGDAYDFPNSYIKYDLRVPFGQLLVFNDKLVCGLRTHMSQKIVASAAKAGSTGCLLFGDPNTPFTPDTRIPSNTDYPPKVKRPASKKHRWSVKLPFQARAMVLASETLFVAGWPETNDPADPLASIEGRSGGVLWVCNAADGKKLAEQKLDSAPVFDGMIAARGRLYISTRNGKVLCMGAAKQEK
ncbi:MAG: PQQ-binding-like beta-propeller repeat protein [Phycisphaerae bacterium]|jgi:outer membrane protein assembly factor BamB|nr:PQQ-binding-like beta-propeller repeat protein [Phycisphaerae bacterium]